MTLEVIGGLWRTDLPRPSIWAENSQGLISQDMSRLNPSSGKYYINLCTQEAVSLLESYGFTVKLNYLKGNLL